MTTKCAVGSDSTEWMVITLLLLAQSSSSPPTQSQTSLGGGSVKFVYACSFSIRTPAGAKFSTALFNVTTTLW